MDNHRIQGVKFNLDRLNDTEISNIRGYLIEKHAQIIAEIALLDNVILKRNNPELPFQNE